MTQVSEQPAAAAAVALLPRDVPRSTSLRPVADHDVPVVALSILVPTRNEADNVVPLVERLDAALGGLTAEVIFVDDSDDATPSVVEGAAQARRGRAPLQISLLHRPPGARAGGLGGAVVAGLVQACGTWVCVMDGDLQHPPETILSMLAAADRHDATLVIASRYGVGGDAAGLSCGARKVLSRAASGAANVLFWRSLRPLSDPMSGFFLFRRHAVDHQVLRPDGFKILVEIAVRTPGLRTAEVPYTFAERHAGASKANHREAFAYARHLTRLRCDLARRRLLDARRRVRVG
jgi:dolichol-phosphate mannosyltransferase